MAYLLDTHVFLWYLLGDPRLSRRAREIVEAKIDLYFSIAGLWEIAIKLNTGKLQIRRSLQELYDELGLMNAEILPIEPEDTITYVNLLLPSNHRDPFDRILIAQVSNRSLSLISADRKFNLYPIQRIWS